MLDRTSQIAFPQY